eukprot:gb/GECG01014903.1/.p1 GENE.gb/GECG01014903.1/~~gb/GECG01014903.1/.p1  ORF type:complete len:803 (+),score=98.06 gb/GECG01014903.1/:1-2409(+)
MKFTFYCCLWLVIVESTRFTTCQDSQQTVSFHRTFSGSSNGGQDNGNDSVLHRFLRKLDKPLQHNQSRDKVQQLSTSTPEGGNDDIRFEFGPASLSEGAAGRLELATKIYSQKDKALVDLSALHEREARQRQHASWLWDECRPYPGHCKELLNVVPRRRELLDSINLEPGTTVESSTAQYVLVHKMTPEDGLSTSLLPCPPTSEQEDRRDKSLTWYGIHHREQAKALIKAYIQDKSILWPSYSEPLVLAGSDQKSPAIRTPLRYLVHPAFDNSLYVPVIPIAETEGRRAKGGARTYRSDTDENYVHPDGTERDHDYVLRGQIGRGGQGEVWRAVKVTEETTDSTPGTTNQRFILKRVFSYRGRRVVESGWREVYFGELLKHHKQVSTLVEYFTVTRHVDSRSKFDEDRIPVTELWLVFEDEGSSLHRFLYDPNANMHETEADTTSGVSEESEEESLILRSKSDIDSECRKLIGSSMNFEETPDSCRHLIQQYKATLPSTSRYGESRNKTPGTEQHKTSYDQPLTASLFWQELRLDPRGGEVFRDLFTQLLQALAQIHRTGVVHRDIKPANIALNTDVHPPLLKLLDFGSALHNTVIDYLYHDPPSQNDETLAYSPPEVLIDQTCAYYKQDPQTYDMWSAGVVVLELLFATQPHELFQVDSREEQIIRHAMKGAESREIRKSILAAGFRQFCIFPPTTSFASGAAHNRSFENTFWKMHQYRHKSGSKLCTDDTLQSFRKALRRYNAENLKNQGLSINGVDRIHDAVRELGEKGEEILYGMLRWDPSERISAGVAMEILSGDVD